MAEAHDVQATVPRFNRRLPLPRTQMVGRDAEVAALSARLRDPNASIVTITGPGGVGKTRLALQVASDADNQFADGVIFVPLSDVARPDSLFRRLSQALQLPVAEPPEEIGLITAPLDDRSLLVVLDNLEQVIDAAPGLARLVDELPGIKLLVTSRIPLRVRGEMEFPLQPLALPRGDTFIDVRREVLEQSPAVVLLVERAKAVDPRFELTEQNASDLIAICARLDGLPLAIELAAARLKVLSPAALLARFDNRLKVLNSGPRDLPERQQTLWDTIAWSYDLLEPDEQAVFRAVSVFSQGFDFDAAAAVLGRESDDPELLDWLGTLVEESLVRSIEIGDQRRLVMLETIREFGLEQLHLCDEEESIREIHAAYYRAFATPAGSSPRTLDVGSADRLERELANIHQALRWYFDHDDADGAVSIVAGIGKFWQTRGYWVEGSRWIDRVMSMITRADPVTQVMALQSAAWFSLGQKRSDDALDRGELALKVARQTGDVDLIGGSLNLLGAIYMLRRDQEQGEAVWSEALEILPEKHRIRSSVLNNYAMLSWIREDPAAAERLFYASIEALPDDERDSHSGNAYVNLAELKFDAGQYDEARLLFMRGMRQFLNQHNTENLFHSLEGAAELEFRDGHPERAAILLGWVNRTQARLGMEPGAFSINYEPVNAQVETALGTERYDELFDRGALLNDDEAARFALGELDLLEARAPQPQAPVALTVIHDSPLTPRELDVLKLVAQGKSNQEIADVLFISMRTAQTHVTNMLGKLALDSRAALAAYAVRHSLA
jgi:predicted ATPase/DNA-binding CsgD family transcriptional regulator